MNENWQDDVLTFWFSELQPQDWFQSSAEIDRQIQARFASLHDILSAEEATTRLDQANATQMLAAILVLDQFSRNLFRGTAKAFAYDDSALKLARLMLDQGLERDMNSQQKSFIYMPFMHSENIDDQNRCVSLFEGLSDLPPASLESARQHRDIIAQFGRFPHRNTVLGRKDTAREKEYLINGVRFGQ